MRKTLMALALSTCLGALALPAQAADADTMADATTDKDTDKHGHKAKELEGVTVNAVPLGQQADQIVAPVAVLSGSALDDAKAGTLGETVAGIPGVQTTGLGKAVGRPVIRGMDGPRVAVLENGLGSQDVSNISQDHATSVEPFLADQIEVLKGPSTLLYGSGAIGGVVNVVDGRIPMRAPANGFAGRAEGRYDSGTDGKTGLFRADAGNDRFALHVDGMRRNDGNYDIPGGTQANSQVKTTSGAVGASVLGDWGYFGASVSRYLDTYGSPAEPGDVDDHGDHDHDEHDGHDHGEEAATIKLAQTRYDVKGGFYDPVAGIAKAEVSFGHNDYQHVEFEGSEVGTTFRTQANEGRILLTHEPLAGWEGAFGVQYIRRNFSAIGDETFVPPTTTKAWGIFLTEQREFGPIKVELGARTDRQTVSPDDQPRRSFSPSSFSAGASWRFADAWHLSLNLDRAQRAPAEEELFANGPHHASDTFEIGNPNLSKETANQAELALHFHGELVEGKVAVYTNRYDNFIYLADTGLEEDGMPVRTWSQHDATFRGAEAEATFHLARNDSGAWDLRAYGDTVRAKLTDGEGNLPRIPAGRLGTQLNWSRGDVRASVGAVRYFAQNKTADFETRTAGYTLVNAHAAWTFHNGESNQWEAFLDGTNLTNRKARLATSLFKDSVLMPGRSVSVGVRAFF
ncbi:MULTISPECIES: TonB-dependent receptor domain-containing protein [Dyella]|uniref:TonB-dependent receptor n=2 Tax=Dyella TaxID=231454 RepID=A0A4R0YY22_9GAMM|nr:MULTISPECIES: TonB-dependent receptor [Dyella]TBR38898.1 TonB-dependent receptor [Dyella terrae]TCI13511.1 TonB-dependent receptor [Dyella soli]